MTLREFVCVPKNMTLREFVCVECGKSHFVLYDDLVLDLRKLLKEELQCPFCGDVATWVRDHNLSPQA